LITDTILALSEFAWSEFNLSLMGVKEVKPRLFIASSVEQIALAHAAQENLERATECTVWTQGVFTLSRTAMASLIDVLDETDFGLFVLAPDDVTSIREQTKKTVRDNVIFELGLFAGRLGIDRCFLIVPRGLDDLHLPSDLLGLAPATYDPDRQDGNLQAALGPACSRVQKAIVKLGRMRKAVAPAVVELPPQPEGLVDDEADCISLIQSWMGARPSSDNRRAIRYDDVDRALRMVPGSARKYIEAAARHWDYVPLRIGKDVIMFQDDDSGR